MNGPARIDPATRDFYRLRGQEWAQTYPHPHSRFLDGFLDRLAPGARILELGCGDGRDAQRMAALGFAVDPTDGVAEMAQLAAERLGRPVRHMQFGELAEDAAYDAVYAHASLHHQPFVGLADVLARIYRALRPGGLFFANFKLGDGEHRDVLGRLYNFPPRAELMARYSLQDWHIIEVDDYRDSGMDKIMRDWIAITASKRQ